MNTETFAKDQSEIIAYHQKSGWQIIRMKAAPVVFARRPAKGEGVEVKAWKGSARVPSWYYSFRNEKSAFEYSENFAKNITSHIAAKQERTEKKKAVKASNFWQVGDVVYTSWGYDQTNVDFFQIVALKPKSVVWRKITANSSDCGGPYGGKIAPRRNEFCGPETTSPITDAEGTFKAGTKHWKKHVSKWTGRAMYCSSYH